MLKRLVLTLILLQSIGQAALSVCPVATAMSINAIAQEVKSKVHVSKEYIYYGFTPTGFMLSVKDEVMFDENGELKENGKLILKGLAQIMKTSGRKWMILVHSREGDTQVHRISRTSLRAGAITNYLTDQEQCLINQLFPIGFGSIMPTRHTTQTRKALGNRIDFLVEDYNLRLDR